MSKTLVLKDERCLNHITRSGHPESPKRLEAIYEKLKDDDIRGKFSEIKPRVATKEEISLNHSMEYIEKIENTAGKHFINLDPDTNTSEGSWQASILAAGAVMTGIDKILDKSANNGFAIIRPPGHHAEMSRAMGFCLFNNIAIGARYLIENHGLKRILIVDWDIHHGNGTQNSFYNSPEVLYFSTHQFPYFPGTGRFEETGEKDGKGYTVNVPLSGGQGDGDFLRILREILQPVAEEYNPQFILVSAGYDTYQHDPLGTMNVTPEGFFLMTKFLKHLAEKQCDGRLLLSLEGGYHVEGIAESVKCTLRGLSDEETDISSDMESREEDRVSDSNIESTIEKVRKIHSENWLGLK